MVAREAVRAPSPVVADSPSPMPPPRSRPRGVRGGDRGCASPDPAASVAPAGGGDRVALAKMIFGVVVLLASEWVEVGSGLAEVSLRGDVWGQRLLVAVVKEVSRR